MPGAGAPAGGVRGGRPGAAGSEDTARRPESGVLNGQRGERGASFSGRLPLRPGAIGADHGAGKEPAPARWADASAVRHLPDQREHGVRRRPALCGAEVVELLSGCPFTLDECDGDGAITPEILGTLVEEQTAGRHEAGAYYTPRTVVSFMCREAIKGYLSHATRLTPALIESLVDQRQCQHLTAKQRCSISDALHKSRAVDPACGSGAYLMGLLDELSQLHRALGDESTPALERRIIEHNLHGIDADASAVHIARLRLSLALLAAGDDPDAPLRTHLLAGDALLGLDRHKDWANFDIVLANPPYVPPGVDRPAAQATTPAALPARGRRHERSVCLLLRLGHGTAAARWDARVCLFQQLAGCELRAQAAAMAAGAGAGAGGV